MYNEVVIHQDIVHSKKIMASYSMGQFFGQWINNTFGMFVFFFYETEMGLNVVLCGNSFYSLFHLECSK